MRTEIAALTILPDTTLRRAMRAIDDGRAGIALVVDASGRLRGTVTDGDLRRALLNGGDFDVAVEGVMNRRFTSVRVDATTGAVLELMRVRSIQQIPVIDRDGILRGLYCIGDLTQPVGRPNWVVIMAGGEGRRLRPLTEKTPKPMLPIGDRPLLENLIRLLVAHRFQEIFVSINYLGEQIHEHFGDGRALNCRIHYLRETKPLGTAGALSLLPSRPQDPMLILNGDLVTELDFSALMDYHAQSACLGTQCVLEYVQTLPFGVVRCEDDHVVELEEKPSYRQLINAGIYVMSPNLLDLVPPDREFTMPELMTAACRIGYPVAAFPIREQWADIGRLGDYERACEDWRIKESRRSVDASGEERPQ